MILPDKKYHIIYADPPWTFRTWSDKGKGKSAEQHYDCMSMEDIKNLPVQDICEEDAACIMWVTFPLLKEGIETLEAWGFKYKTVAFNWVKRNKKANSWFVGMGYYTRQNTEVCLIGVKKKPHRFKPLVRNELSAVMHDRLRHSVKPNIFRKKIVNIIGDLPRIELFARQKTPGWDVWGNEV